MRRVKGGMRSEAITDKSDIKAGVVAKVQQRKRSRLERRREMQQTWRGD